MNITCYWFACWAEGYASVMPMFLCISKTAVIMDNPPPEKFDTADQIFVNEETKTEAGTDLSEPDNEHIEWAVGEAINQDGQLDQINAQNTTQQTYDNDGEAQLTSDEGKVIEGAVGGATVSCDQCETETAVMYCQNCPGNLCKICYDTHKKSKLTRNHSYINMSPHLLTASLHVQNENVSSQEKESNQISCKDHPDKLAKVICKTCAHPACSACSRKHNRHNVVELHQKHFRQLQSVCLDDSQLLLSLISKLETLRKTASSEGLYANAIHNMSLAKQGFDALTREGSKHNLVVESLIREKLEVTEKHNKKLDDITQTLDEATFIMSKLHFAGTTTDINLVFEALNNFYVLYNTLKTKYATLLAQKYTKPDSLQLENTKTHMTSLEQALDCYKNPGTRYDMLKHCLSNGFRTVLDFVATSKQNLICTTDDCCLTNYDIKSETFGNTISLQHIAFRLALLSDTRVVGLTSDKYIVYDENLKMLSCSYTMSGHRAFLAWDSHQILVFTYKEKCKVFLLNVSEKIHKSTIQFEISDIFGCETNSNLLMSRNSSGEIIIISQDQSKLHKFKISGKLLTSVDLTINSKTLISSFYVDGNDNLVVGCTNGEVYFVDYKSNKKKLLLSLGRAVTRIGEIDGKLYVFVCFTTQVGLEAESKGVLYIYDIDKSCEHSN